MAEKKWSPLTIIGVGLVGLGGVGIGYLWWKSTLEQELIREYLDEAEMLFNFQITVSQKPGGPTDADYDTIDSMVTLMEGKEKRIESFSETWFHHLTDDVTKLMRNFGVYAIIYPVVGFVTAATVYWLFKKFPPRPRPPTCPKCGLVFNTPDELQEHIETVEEPTAEQAAIAEAQAILQQEPSWVYDSVAAISRTYNRAYLNWWQLSPLEILAIAAAIAAVSVIIAPSIAPAAALLLI